MTTTTATEAPAATAVAIAYFPPAVAVHVFMCVRVSWKVLNKFAAKFLTNTGGVRY